MTQDQMPTLQPDVSLKGAVESLLAEWTGEHSLTDAEQQRIRSVLECQGITEQDFHDELNNVLARRRIDRARLDRARLLAIGEAYRNERRQRLDPDPHS